MLDEYKQHAAERAALGLPPKPLNSTQTTALVELLVRPPAGEEARLHELVRERGPGGVDPAAAVKAAFLSSLARGEARSPLIDRARAVALLGGMSGGHSVAPLVALLDDDALGERAAVELAATLLIFDAFGDVAARAAAGCEPAARVLRAWADAEWFTRRPAPPRRITVIAFKIDGEITTDDLSPAVDAWSRPDIPLHARSLLRRRAPDALAQLAALRRSGHPVAFVGDVVGTGSSRKSATNSLLWHIGEDTPHAPNKRRGGVCLGGKIAPIFRTTLEDAGALAIECDVSRVATGDVLIIDLDAGALTDDAGALRSTFTLRSPAVVDALRAGGRIPLIIGRALTARAREALGLPPSPAFHRPAAPAGDAAGFTLAQKIVGRACGVAGVRPGTYCEPRVSAVGSQDTTGPMTRDELTELACREFSADLVVQSFCHTAAYPRPIDVEVHRALPEFFRERGGVALRPGDGILHPWLNRMLLPDQVGTGGDSHTRFPLGISFPAGSGMVAFAAALGVLPLDMPESVLVRFRGARRPGVTVRDLVHAIPYAALERGDLTLARRGKRNLFSGRILEIEGLEPLTVEQAFELSDATAERSAAGCTIRLDERAVRTYMRSNAALLRAMIAAGYQDARALERRLAAMEAWLADPVLLAPDPDAAYAAVLEIDVDAIREPLLACPNDPDDVRPLSAVAGRPIDEVFIGSCMTHVGHLRAAARLLAQRDASTSTRLWVAPPTELDRAALVAEGHYASFASAGARTETPGCSLCMGNQARVAKGASVVSTSTRNFPNRLGDGARVYLASAEVAAVTALLGRIPTLAEYRAHTAALEPDSAELYRPLDFARRPALARPDELVALRLGKQ